uniref:Translation machinery-associated protein 16 n=1 Tax=Strigamia maritima TaxID=126957 RepID=T1IS66_STRMM
MTKPAKAKKPKAKQPLKKGIHPNSRKAMKVMGAALRQDRLAARKSSKLQKRQIIVNKLEWFRDHLEENTKKLTNEEILHLIETYFRRFDSELEQISIVHGIKGRKSQQHAARHDVISHQIETDERDFNTCGIGKI